MSLADFEKELNTWGQRNVPFLFIVDFELKKPMAWRLSELDSDEILFDINGFSNATIPPLLDHNFSFQFDRSANSFYEYQTKFKLVMDHLSRGDSFLTNLTVKTKIEINRSLRDLFFLSKARYKLWYNEQFLVFSPEIFIQIHDQKIYSFPMKGTTDASIPNARDLLLNDEKELAEHTTIVDLIRNDLSIVAASVCVNRFRYIEEIETNNKTLLQVSSEIQGELTGNYRERLGSILVSLLPAGSISGAPKKKTLEIIKDAEREERGYYTGVFGYFDGKKLDAGVMIRYIEKTKGGLFYRSGGGITTQSRLESEYQETINKIYAPIY